MNEERREIIYRHAKKWILEAGELIRKKINDPLIVETKSNPKDLVTAIDREAEYLLAKNIKSTFPDHFLFSEEGYGEDLKTLEGIVWIVDPIDGTMNFVKQKRNFAISIGIFYNGIGEIGLVYDCMGGNLYTALRGNGAYKNGERLPDLASNLTLEESILDFNHYLLCENDVIDETVMQLLVEKVRGARSYCCAALALAYVAEGIVDGYLTKKLAPWDIAGGMIIANEVGAVTTKFDGNLVKMLINEATLTCHPAIQKEIFHDYLKKGKK